MEKFDSKQMDEALEKLLRRATDPAVPAGAEGRLMAAIRAGQQPANVVKFHPRPAYQRLAIGLPLAASLLLGIYLGSRGTLDRYMPESILGQTVAGATDQDLSTGLDDAESYEDGELT